MTEGTIGGAAVPSPPWCTKISIAFPGAGGADAPYEKLTLKCGEQSSVLLPSSTKQFISFRARQDPWEIDRSNIQQP
jgi:hypothetical protein